MCMCEQPRAKSVGMAKAPSLFEVHVVQWLKGTFFLAHSTRL